MRYADHEQKADSMSEKTFEFPGLFAYLGGRATPASVTVIRDFSQPMNKTFRVSVWIGEQTYEGISFDAFDALEKARERFEPHGWLLGIKGCTLRCHMSGMLRDTRDGMLMYASSAVAAAGLPDTVSTFAPAPLTDLATVEVQRTAWHNAPGS